MEVALRLFLVVNIEEGGKRTLDQMVSPAIRNFNEALNISFAYELLCKVLTHKS